MTLEEEVKEALYDVYDPELGINIVDLGLVYGVSVDEQQNVRVTMTLTTPGCPLHDSIQFAIENRLGLIEGIAEIEVELVWDPPWDPGKISEQGRKWLWG